MALVCVAGYRPPLQGYMFGLALTDNLWPYL